MVQRLMAAIMAAMVVIGIGACSVPDGDDMGDLMSILRGLGPEDSMLLKIMAQNRFSIRWAEKEPIDNQMAKIQCRDDDTGKFKDIVDEASYTIRDLLKCLKADTHATVMSCVSSYDAIHKKQAELTRYFGACRSQFDDRYLGKLPKELTDLNWMDNNRIAEVLLMMPAPPPGMVWGGELAKLLPILCAMDVSWGCPDDPEYPGAPQQPSEPGTPDNGSP